MRSDSRLRVALDLDGSLESLGNSMTDLSRALEATDACDLVRFRSGGRALRGEVPLRLRPLWLPLWRHSRGVAIDSLLPVVDVVHVAGLATPPTKRVPLVISVDDLRPLRGEAHHYLRVGQLRRAVDRGALLIASTRRASHEVQDVLRVDAHCLAVVPPAVPEVRAVEVGHDLVLNVTGLVDAPLAMLPSLVRFAEARGAKVVVVSSASFHQHVRSLNLHVTCRLRHEARDALADARVVLHVSDGARFPSFAIAALAAGVPTMARATAINRELLSGAAALLDGDDEVLVTLEELWESEPRRAVMIAAGRARAGDFAPSTAASAYLALYREVVRAHV